MATFIKFSHKLGFLQKKIISSFFIIERVWLLRVLKSHTHQFILSHASFTDQAAMFMQYIIAFYLSFCNVLHGSSE